MLWRGAGFQLIPTFPETGGVDALRVAAHRHHKKRQVPCCRRLKLFLS
jgi:hypothetical protein